MLNSQAMVCIRALHAWLALAQRPKELNLFKAEHKAGTSGDTRILTQQLRSPVKGQGNSKCFADWAVPTTQPAGCTDEASQQWGALTISSGLLCLIPYTAHGIVFKDYMSDSSTILGSQPPLSGEIGRIYRLYTPKGLERKASVFFVFEVSTLSSPYH